MSNDGTSFKPWKVRKGVFKSTGVSDYDLPSRNTPSPIVEMPLSPPIVKTPSSPLQSPRITIVESPLSSFPSPSNHQPLTIVTTPLVNQPQIIHRTIREIPIERADEVRIVYVRVQDDRI
jgi:hypothetical protein